MRDDHARLQDILEAIERIERYSGQGKATFEQDELVQNWIVHHLEIIGEACRALSAALRNSHPEVAWSQISGMRNILIHRYFDIDIDVTWQAVEHDVPILKGQIEAILQSLP